MDYTGKIEWPVAYAQCINGQIVNAVPLKRHLYITACLQECIARERFKPEVIISRSPRLKSIIESYAKSTGLDEKEAIYEIVYSIGLLHDLGKASSYYQREFVNSVRARRTSEASFRLHEYVVALALEYVSYKENNELYKAVYDLMAKVISRHHAAMKERSPIEVSNELVYIRRDDVLKTIKGAIMGMKQDRVVEFIEDLMQLCRRKDSLCTRVLGELKDVFMNLESKTLIEILDRHTVLKSFQLSGPRSSEQKTQLHVYALVVSLTGSLTIADNLAAMYEGRSTDERGSPLYVKTWIRELGGVLDECLKRCDLTPLSVT